MKHVKPTIVGCLRMQCNWAKTLKGIYELVYNLSTLYSSQKLNTHTHTHTHTRASRFESFYCQLTNIKLTWLLSQILTCNVLLKQYSQWWLSSLDPSLTKFLFLTNHLFVIRFTQDCWTRFHPQKTITHKNSMHNHSYKLQQVYASCSSRTLLLSVDQVGTRKVGHWSVAYQVQMYCYYW